MPKLYIDANVYKGEGMKTDMSGRRNIHKKYMNTISMRHFLSFEKDKRGIIFAEHTYSSEIYHKINIKINM